MEDFPAVYEKHCKELGVSCRKQVIASVENAASVGAKSISLILRGSNKDLFGNRIGDGDIEAIVNAVLEAKVVVSKMIIPHNRITDKGVEHIARLFHKSEHTHLSLYEIDLSGNDLSPVGAELLAATIEEQGPSLRRLDISYNDVGGKGALAMARMLQKNLNLRQLDLGYAELETMGLIALCTALRTNGTLDFISFENARIPADDEDVIYHVVKMLRENKGLESLCLAKFQIRDHGAALLAEYLADNTTLRHLDLRCNRIGGKGAIALASLLVKHDSLVSLNLHSNRITSEGAKAFEVAIRKCTTLESLDLRYNDIQDDGLTYVLNALWERQALQKLTLWGNHFKQRSLAELHELYCAKGALEGLAIDARTYVVDGEVHVSKQDI